MTNREIIVSDVVSLIQEDNDFILTKTDGYPYKLREGSRTYHAIKILDLRCQLQQKKYACANEHISRLESKLQEIESSVVYKFFHKLGVI